ncbi:hypothetical protein EDB81DRAFT_814893 [Dactylonectria macrodidyma]|uniref:F-box domain-containing protein n=1 Tax=Dactylonectria macrodidyma TaxID=307937 RepID=A0A9P9DER2_9HYPO|nr:hypothetical protein EDB81DRAFT_814893 [Dactylonectria macrodidyma]
MDSSVLRPAVQGILREAYNILRIVNDDLRKAQADLLRASSLWTLHQDSSENPDHPEHYVDSGGQTLWSDREDSETWVLEARSKGLFDSKLALTGELKRLGVRKRKLEDIQHKIRLSTNELSQLSLRSRHLFNLPDEILSRVFDFVEGSRPDIPSLWHIVSQDMKNCRLTCQRFCRVSSRFFLRSVSVDLSVSSMSRFEEISRHPTISKGIRVVRAVLHFYDPFLSDNIEDFILYHAAELEERAAVMEGVRTWEFCNVPEETGLNVVKELKAISASWRRIAQGTSETQAQPLTEEDHTHLMLLRTTHQKYQRLCSDQEELSKSGKFAQTVAAGIAKMPCARILYLLDWDHSIPKGVRFFDYDDINVPIHKAMLQPMNWYTAYKNGFAPRLLDSITKLPVAVQHFGAWLERIYIELSYVDAPSNLLPTPEVRQQLPSAMQQLQRFSFECKHWINGESDEEILYDILAPCLNTPSLRELAIDMLSDEEPDDHSTFGVGRLIASQQWRNLSYLFLRDVAFHLSEFQLFVCRPHEASYDLKLDRVRLLSGTWAEVLDTLREKSIRSMRLCDPRGAECDSMSSDELSSIFGKSDFLAWSQAELYVKRITDLNPLSNWSGSTIVLSQ